ncbi:MAG: Stp1/IreP family PP2C-type Ser/Thr phosphatase [Deltaproteobacteria bacterium]|nr:Stp1/IreP family PP2C-type Ser/Thr phosphatase [Deltaproteobacteria bacterium]
MRVTSFGMTDVGRKRKANEDSFFIDEKIGMFLVADGMGGHAAGEVASATAVQVIHRELSARYDQMDTALKNGSVEARNEALAEVSKAIEVACREVFAIAEGDESKKGMGTTIAMLFVFGEEAIVAHVGDSRVYMLRDGESYQLTEDHSLVQEQLARGLITPEEAKNAPYSNVITRALGIQESVQADTLYVELMPGDEFMLCSDGFHGYLADGELPALMKGVEQQAIVGGMINLANERGGKDNVTVIHVRAAEEERAPEAVTPSAKIEALRNIPLFRYLDYKELVKVINVISMRAYDEGQDVIVEGDPGEELFVILTGGMTVKKAGKVIAMLRPMKHFGEMALVDKEPRSATVTATAPSKLMVIKRKDFVPMMRQEPQIGVKLLWSFVQVLSQRLRTTSEELSEYKNMQGEE